MKKAFLLLTLLFSVISFSQVGIGTTTPDASSVLDISATDKGILVPRISLANINSTTIDGTNTAATGLLVYNTNASVIGGSGVGFYMFNGLVWERLTTTSDTVGDDLGNHIATTTLDMDSNIITNVQRLSTVGVSDYDKLRLYSSSNYTIGMHSAMTYGFLNDWATTFTMNQDDDRGWVFRDVNDIQSDGAMSLTTNGRMTVKNYLSIPNTADATHLINSGAFQVGGSLRIDGDEIITNTNLPLYLQNGNNGDLYVDTNTLVVNAANDRVGIGTNTPSEDLHVYRPDNDVARIYATGTTQGSGMFYAGQSETYGGGFVYDGDGAPALVGGTDRVTFFRRNNGADTDVMSYSYNNSTLRLPSLAGTGSRMVVANALGDLSTQAISVGDISGVVAGNGLIGGGTTGTVTVTANANNGLTVDTSADAIQLGGPLTENTTITQGAFNMIFNLSTSGDFSIQDNGVSHFQVADNGITYFGDDTYWRDGSTVGTNLARLLDDGNDGRFLIYENGNTSVDLDANTQFIFNEQGLDRNFRIESDLSPNMFFVDAGLGNIGIKTGATQRNLHLYMDRYTGGGGYGGLELEQSFTGNSWVLYTSQSSDNLVFYYNNTNMGYIDNVTGVYTATSDLRLKKNIVDIDGSLSKLLELKPKLYHFKTQDSKDARNPGFIAQEVKEIFPDLVKVVQDDTKGSGIPDLHTLSYTEFVPYIIKGMQEQQEIIENQNKEIEALKRQLELQQKLLEKIQKQIGED